MQRGGEIREGFLEEVMLKRAEELSWKCSGTSGLGWEVAGLMETSVMMVRIWFMKQ